MTKRREHLYAGYLNDPREERRFKSFFSPPKPSLPPPLPPLPKSDDPEISRRKEEARLAQLRRKGLDDSILTSGLGDTSPPPVNEKTLLGGAR